MRRVHYSIIALASAALACAGALATADAGNAASVVARANSQTYTDPTGDSGSGPDVGGITVSNDDTGKITFQVGVPNRPSLAASDVVLVFVDSDLNSTTGMSGIDYIFGFIGPLAVVFKVDPPGTPQPTSLPTFSGFYAGGTGTFSVNRSDIGTTVALRFYVLSSGDGFTTKSDDAPDGDGIYLYFVAVSTAPPPPPPAPPAPAPPAAAPFSLKVASLKVPKARAGRSLTASMEVMRSDTSALLTQGTIACSATLAGKPLPVRSKGFKSGLAGCTWVLPAGARGKVLRGTIAVTFGGASVKRSFSARVA